MSFNVVPTAPSAPARKLSSLRPVRSFIFFHLRSVHAREILPKGEERKKHRGASFSSSDAVPTSDAVMLPPVSIAASLVLALTVLLSTGISPSHATDYKTSKNYDDFFNKGVKLSSKSSREKLPNQIEKSKVDVLGSVLKKQVESLRKTPNKELELVFLIDSSASVGAENFFNELKFVKKLLADFTVEYNATRVSVITFSSRNRVVKHIDHVSNISEQNHKCSLFEEQLPTINYQGGGTYTLGAVLQAQVSDKFFLPNLLRRIKNYLIFLKL